MSYLQMSETSEPMQTWEVTTNPYAWWAMAMDSIWFCGELLKSDGFNVIYIVSNWLMKMVHFIPTTTNISTPDLMKLHIHHIWKLHGIPLVHGTDCRSTFTVNFTKNIYKELGIEPQFSTAYHPQTQGQVENNNKWMEMYLWMLGRLASNGRICVQ